MEDIYAGGMEDIDSKQYNIIHAAVSHTLDDKTGLYRLFFFFFPFSKDQCCACSKSFNSAAEGYC